LVDADAVRPGFCVVRVVLRADVSCSGRRGRGRARELAEAFAGRLSCVRTLAALYVGVILRAARRDGKIGLAAGIGPGRIVVGVPLVADTTNTRGRGRGRARKLAEALAGHLSSVRTLAALDMGVVVGAARRDGKIGLAAGLGPGRIVVGVPLVADTTRHRGRGRGRARELAEALAGRLSSVRTLAALKVGAVLGPVSAVEREGKLVLAAGNGPGRIVVGVPEVNQTAGNSRRGRGRAREIAEALAGHLPSVSPLAARKLGRVARFVRGALALELAVAVRPVAGRVPLHGLGSVATGADTSREERGQKDVYGCVLAHRW